ncbi:protein NO VEIN-like [Anneissia japonica]|uniref:protein NO VEIN-like n=1 Tax=Anneissia japonica TaxID=1529436 RepID=UPI001425939D|nr:protein NO VEIN-like [Anneissia japonica]
MARHHKRDDIKKNLRELLRLNPFGIPLDSLTHRYSTHFKVNLNLRGNGIKGIRSIPDNFNWSEIVSDASGEEILRLKKEGKAEVKKAKKEFKRASAQTSETLGNQTQQVPLNLEKKCTNVGKVVKEPSKIQSNQQVPSYFSMPLPHILQQPLFGQQITNVEHEQSVSNKKSGESLIKPIQPLLPQGFHQQVQQSETTFGYLQASSLPQGPQEVGLPTSFPSSPHQKIKTCQSSQIDERKFNSMSPTEFNSASKQPSRDTHSIGNIIFGNKAMILEPSIGEDSHDWPTLSQGATKKKTKEKSKKDPKAEAENRRIKFDHLDISGIQNRKVGKRPTKDDVNSRALFHIQALAEQNEHVSIELVMKGVMEYFGQTSIRQLGLYKETDLQAIHEHQRLLCRINAYISAFCKCRSIATLYELLQDLENIQEGKDSFEELNVGPLSKFPAVYNLFKFPPYQSDDDIIKVTTMDILELLRNYMGKNDLWRSKVDLKGFMEFIMEDFGVSDPYQLGIRVQSIALGVSVLKKAQREEKNTMDECRRAILAKLKQEVEASLESVKKSILEPANTDRERSRLDIRKRYADMTAAEAILKVFENAQPLLNQESRLRGFFRALPAIVNNELARNLFQLAICLGNMEFPQDFMPAGSKEEEIEEENEQTEVEPSVCANKIPDQEEIISDVENFLNRLQDVPTLHDLSRIESRLCQNRNLSSFLDFKKGTFLQFITKTPKLLQQFGGSILGATNQKANQGTPYYPSPHDLIDFIRQCGKQNMNDMKLVETALCEHFQTTSTDTFGRGSLQRLILKAKSAQDDEEQNSITYEQALYTQTRMKHVSGSQFGVRGHQSLCNALLSLNSTPLLEDLADWSHWTLIFKPEYGELKGFIEKWSGAEIPYEPEDSQLDEPIKIFALETQPGVLLKLASKTSPDDFKNAAINEDARLTAGHLVSILTRDGIQNAPLVLLQNYFESALKAIFSKDIPLVPGGPPEKTDADIKVASFVLDCLIVIPTKICHAVAEVMLKPLSEVIGDKRSKKLLKDSCVTTKQLNKLQELGYLLGIVEWSETFTLRLENPTLGENLDEHEDMIDIASLLPEDKPESDKSSIAPEEEKDNLSSVLDEDLDLDTEPEDVGTPCNASPANGELSTPTPAEELQEDEADVKDEVESDIATHANTLENTDLDEDFIDNLEDNQKDMQSLTEDEIAPPVKLTPCQEEMQHCKAVVDNIRKNEFGIGAILGKEGESLMEVQKGRIVRSLERLSTELYSKDTHFVLELVQNADDNTYNDDCQQPSLLFQLEDGQITVYNNEKGFSAENIHALCDVGKSTKGKHKYGYIGHKGIGFKSVFRVTERPEIHSNGFHICFDRQADSLGYILPTWIGASKIEDVTEDGDKDSKGWQTRIVLPLKDEVCKTNKLLNRFDDIQPSLLLFLHRLRSIQVVNQPKASVVEMKRIDHPKSVIEIKHSDGTDFWLVVKEMINVNNSVCERVDVESTELALAFPLPNSKSTSDFVLKDQNIFAYLPLRSYGFKFIIQGDFDIPSSREDVDSDSAWNQWIKQHLPAVFIKALQFFKDYYGSNNEEVAVCKFLQFVPVEGQILGFFKSVAKNIHQKLKSFPCLPVQVPDEKGSTVWKQPSEAIIVHDPLVQELVPPEVLHCHLGCYFLSNVVCSMLNVALLKSLGVKVITTSNLISLFKGEVLKAKADGVGLSIPYIAKWITCIYRCREEEHDISEEPIKEMQALPIIPLSNGKWTDLQDKSVFFSLTFEKQRTDVYAPKKAAKKEMQGSIQILESDMYILHGDLMTCQDSLANSQVMLMMEHLGVCHIKPYDVIHNHILPALRAENWEEKRTEVLISYIVYIKDQMQLHQDICKMSDIKVVARIRTDRGTFVNPSREPIHFTMTYGNKYDLRKDLTGGDWTFVDECYLRSSKQFSPSHTLQWHQFLSELGVLNLIAIERKTLTLQKTDMDSSIWSSECKTWPVPSDGCYQVEDSRSKQLEKLLENNTKGTDDNHRVMNNLLNILDKEWDNFSKFVTASLVIGNQRKKSIESSFAKLLLRSSWISTSPMLDPELGTRTGKRLLPPNQVFLFSKYLRGFLDEHVPYLLGSTPENRELVHFLGLKGEDVVRDVNFLLHMLQSWCTRGKNSQPDEIMKSGAVFTTSIEHMLQVYIHLQLHSPPGQLQKFFENFPAVFLPSSVCEQRRVVTGKFVHKSLTYWMDPTELFHKYSAPTDRVSVIEFYGSSQDFFQKHLRIDEAPNMLEYLQLLVKITSENQLPNTIVHSDVLKIFEILGEKCARSGHTYGKSNLANNVIDVDTNRASYLKNNLKEYKVFPTKANRWVSLDDEPMIVDEGSKDLEELFSSNQDIHFLLEDAEENLTSKRGVKSRSSINRKGTHEYENVQRFLQVCELKHLSDCVKTESIQVLISPCPSLKNLMHHVVPYVQSFLLSKYHEVHERLVSKFKIQSKLKIMNFMTVSSLEVAYRLEYLKNGEYDTAVMTTKQKCMITNNFYVNKTIEKNIKGDSSVRKEVAKFFSDGDNDCQKEMQQFLRSVMAFEDEEFLDEWGVSRVQGVDLWEVEKVEEPKPIPVLKTVVPVTSENENTTKNLEKNEDGPGIYCWPPKSSAYGVVKSDKAKNPSEEESLKQWPPPLPAQPLIDVPPSQQHNIPRELGIQDFKAMDKRPPSDSPNDRQLANDHQLTANSASNVDNIRSDVTNRFGINTLPDMSQGELNSTELAGKTSAYPTSPGTGVSVTEGTSAYPTSPGASFNLAEGTSARSGVDGQFQTPPNPHRIASLSGTPKSTPRSTPKSFSASPPSEVQLIEEDITPDLLDLPFFEETQINVSNPSDDIVGRWGEELVYHLLKNQYMGDSNMKCTVRWANEQDETGNPYDIEIHTNYEGGVCIEYVEVKATNSSEKKHFQISANEVTFAQQKAPHYHLYRVYNAGKKDTVKVCSLKNLSEKMVKKQVVLLMKI